MCARMARIRDSSIVTPSCGVSVEICVTNYVPRGGVVIVYDPITLMVCPENLLLTIPYISFRKEIDALRASILVFLYSKKHYTL